MKKIGYYIFLFALLLIAGCSKETCLPVVPESDVPASAASDLVVCASIQGEDSKVSLTVESNALKAEWELGDRIIVFDADDHTYGYKVVAIKDEVASMQLIPLGEEGCGNVDGSPSEGVELYAAYCPGYGPDDVESGVLNIDISAQNGDAGKYAVMLSQATAKDGNLIFKFKNRMSILGVRNPVLAGLTEGQMTGFVLAGDEIYNRARICVEDGQVQLLPESLGSVTVALDPITVTDGNTPEGTLILAAVIPFKKASDLEFSAILSDKTVLFRHYKQNKLFVACKYYRTSPKLSRENAIGGQFSVSATKKVFFSKGNLWCNASVEPAAWAFESDQHFIPYYNIHEGILNVYDSTHVRHFFWSDDDSYGSSEHYDGSSFPTAEQHVDWGEIYCNSCGVQGWTTLSAQEWNYLFNVRGSGSTFYRTNVSIADNSENYIVIAPDGNTEEIQETYNLLEWRAAEKKGFVCLAPSGYRSDANYPDVPCMFRVGINGFYWTSDAAAAIGDRAAARSFTFGKSPYAFSVNGRYARSQGFSVRLVCE